LLARGKPARCELRRVIAGTILLTSTDYGLKDVTRVLSDTAAQPQTVEAVLIVVEAILRPLLRLSKVQSFFAWRYPKRHARSAVSLA
jgi:hypothetical protein